MKAQPSLVGLGTLRRLFGRRLPPNRLPTTEGPIRPGRWRKVYGGAVREQWVYRATSQKPKGKLRPLEQIAKDVDKRPIIELLEERDPLLKQLCARGACGDKQALNLIIS